MNWNKRLFEKLMQKLGHEFVNCMQVSKSIYYENINYSRNLPYELNVLLFAKGIADRINGKIIGIMPNHKQNRELLKIVNGELDDIEEKATILELIEIYIRLILIIFVCHKGSDIGKIHCRKILLGDLIYSDIVRKNKNVFTLEKADILKYWNTYKKIITWTVRYDNKFRKNPPAVFVACEIMYIEGTLYRLAAKYNSIIVEQPFLSRPLLMTEFANDYQYNYDKLIYEEISRLIKSNEPSAKDVENINELIFNRKAVDSKQAFDPKKKIFAKEELMDLLHLDPHKKNIVIVLHCLTDACYCENTSIYKDYYSWYVDTIKKVRKISKVNWLFREHPMSSEYGDKKVVKKIFDENKNENTYWMSSEFNGKNVPVLADAIITVSGTVGVEYSALGIPCVVLGKPFYSRFGYTININSENEYIHILNKMDRICKLSKSKQSNAKRILWIYLQECKPSYDTEIEGLICEFRNRIHNKIPYHEAEAEFINHVLMWLEENEIKKSRIYQMGCNLFTE